MSSPTLPAPARRQALSLLGEVRRKRGRARDIMRGSAALEALSARDRALVTRLVLGTITARGLVDSVVFSHVRRPSSLEPVVRDALALATFELLFLGTPAAVCVSEGVELVRTARPRAAGLANAVLRRVADEDVPRRREACVRVDEQGGCETADLAWVSGYPAWLLERVARERSREQARLLALSATEPAPVWVSVNRARHTLEEGRRLLDGAGLEPHAVEGMEGTFRLGAPADLARSGLVDDVDVVVADLSAQEVARRVASVAGECILECGQGRGTKSVLIEGFSLDAGGPREIVGIDSEAFKVRVASARMRRGGLDRWVRCLEADARSLGPSVTGSFDVVFVDAPCSGTGTLRRHPEIAWSVTEADVDELSSLQLDILAGVASRVRDGGILAYATCSVLEQENEGVIDAFLEGEAGDGFARLSPDVRFDPAPSGPDGHYLCLMRHGL